MNMNSQYALEAAEAWLSEPSPTAETTAPSRGSTVDYSTRRRSVRQSSARRSSSEI